MNQIFSAVATAINDCVKQAATKLPPAEPVEPLVDPTGPATTPAKTTTDPVDAKTTSTTGTTEVTKEKPATRTPLGDAADAFLPSWLRKTPGVVKDVGESIRKTVERGTSFKDHQGYADRLTALPADATGQQVLATLVPGLRHEDTREAASQALEQRLPQLNASYDQQLKTYLAEAGNQLPADLSAEERTAALQEIHRGFNERYRGEITKLVAEQLETQDPAAAKMVVDQVMQSVADRQEAGIDDMKRAMESRYSKENDIGGMLAAMAKNPWNWLVPAGLLFTLFGGKAGKMVGALAMLVGGGNLAFRANNLLNNDKVQSAIADYARSGMEQPVEEFAQQAGWEPEQLRGVQDWEALAHLGWVREQTLKAGEGVTRGVTGSQPGTPAPQQSQVAALADQFVTPVQNTWGSVQQGVSDWVRNLTGGAK